MEFEALFLLVFEYLRKHIAHLPNFCCALCCYVGDVFGRFFMLSHNAYCKLLLVWSFSFIRLFLAPVGDAHQRMINKKNSKKQYLLPSFTFNLFSKFEKIYIRIIKCQSWLARPAKFWTAVFAHQNPSLYAGFKHEIESFPRSSWASTSTCSTLAIKFF